MVDVKFNYEAARDAREKMTVSQYIYAIRELYGRNVFVERQGKKTVIGCIGTLYADSLTPVQVLYLCGFYAIDETKAYISFVREYPRTKHNVNKCNDYLVIEEKEEKQ